MAELLLGLGLGLGAGLSPGPLLTLVITATLERGRLAGLRVALSPLVTDAPIILVAVLAARALPRGLEPVLGVVGGAFVVYLGAETLRGARHASLAVAPTAAPDSRDLLRGALVNALSPHPWLFWLGVGGPLVSGAWRRAPTSALAFLVGFYALLIGSKVAVALAVSSGRHRLTDAWYRRLLVALGALLVALGLALAWAGLRRLGQE